MKSGKLVTSCFCVVAALSAAAAEKSPIAAKVAADFQGKSGAAVWHYAVPPMSEIQRLADVYPSDGTPDGTVRIVAAKGEYEPGAFLVWATRDLGKVKVKRWCSRRRTSISRSSRSGTRTRTDGSATSATPASSSARSFS